MQKKVLVFDVGRVLIDFSFDPFEVFIKERMQEVLSREAFFGHIDFRSFETGLISGSEFLSRVKNLLPQKTSLEEIEHAWTSIFSPFQDMIDFCSSLGDEFGEKVETYILSNTNELHWKHLDKHYQLASITRKAITSFHAKAMKPDDKIYLSLEEEARPDKMSQIFFIDDMEENIQKAQSRGWHGIVHKDPEETMETVRSFIEKDID